MENKYEILLNIISKLTNEQDMTFTEIRQTYNKLFSIVEEKLPVYLDNGEYIDNASIVRKINKLLSNIKIFSLIPEIGARTFIAIWGKAKFISRVFKTVSSKELGIEFNTKLPLFLIPMKSCWENRIFAITYMDEMVSITFDEYRLVTNFMHQEDIEIRKFIKGFVIYYMDENVHQTFCVLPEYLKKGNKLLPIIKQLVDYQFVIADKQQKWRRRIKMLFPSDVYLFGNNRQLPNLLYKYNIINKEINEFRECCLERDRSCINFAVVIEFQRIFLDVLVFYNKQKNKLQERVTCLAEDLIYIQDEEVKKCVHEYREKCINMQDKIGEGYKKFVKITDEILKYAGEFEIKISNLLLHELPENINANKYVKSLIRVFFKHIYLQDFEAAKDDILKLKRARYSYYDMLMYLLKYSQGDELSFYDNFKIFMYPSEVSEIAKAQLILYEKNIILSWMDKYLIKNVQPLETGMEKNIYGKYLVDEKDYIGASKYFIMALEEGYEKAGLELIKLFKEHPECTIKIEELAERMIPEANLYMAKKIGTRKNKKSLINLKIAASKGNIEAIEMVADILFDKYIIMREDINKYKINYLIDLYEFLNTKEINELYQVKIGILYFVLGNYVKAYNLLKDIDNYVAQAFCINMCKDGRGMAQNLNLAKKHYEKFKEIYKNK